MIACLAACALLVAIITPALATSRSRFDRVACLSNLRQIGTALRQFALEHDGNPAWTQVAGPDGNYNQPGKHELWFQYWWLRDLLLTPKILMDPAETRPGARVATEWDLTPESGLQSLKNRAVAYGLATGHYSSYYESYQYTDVPRMILTLDRHFIPSYYTGGVGLYLEVKPESTGWRDEIHGVVGNVAFADGSVDSLSTEQLREAVRKITNTYSGSYLRILSADWW